MAGDQALGQREMEKARLYNLTTEPQKKTREIGNADHILK